MEEDPCGALTADGPDTIMTIEVTAGHGHDLFPSGYNPWRRAIGCRVRAKPEGGRANRAIIGLVGSRMGVVSDDVTIHAGMTSTLKKIRLSNVSHDQACLRLRSLFGKQTLS